MVLQLICERQAGIALLMEPLSGNNSDAVSFRDTIRSHIDQLRQDVKVDYLIADSALYSAETLQQLSEIKWISRVPATLSVAREMLHASAGDLMSNLEHAAFRSLGTVYAEVRQRWLVVFSPAAYQRA